jgi:hypothetical protein
LNWPHLLPQRPVDERVARVQAHTPEVVAERVGDVERGAHGVVVEVDEHGDRHLPGVLRGERPRRRDGVAGVRGDEAVRDRAHARAAPPRRLRIGRHADRAGDVRGPAVAGLHEPVVVPGGEEEDLLAAGRLDDLADVAHDERPPRERAEVDRLEVREQRVVAGDLQHGLERRDLVALVQRADLERPEVVGALAQDRDRLVDPPQDGVLLLEHLHDDLGATALGLEQLLRQVEVLVRVVARADAVDGEPEDVAAEALTRRHRAASAPHARRSRGRGRGRARRSARPRRG